MRLLVCLSLLLGACTAKPSVHLAPVAAGPTDYVEPLPPGFSAQTVKADLEAAIVERFGAAAYQRALSAEGYVMSRHYQGLAPPPPPPGSPPPLPLAALLIQEGGTWLRAETGGAFRPLTAGQAQNWQRVLENTGPWSEPTFAHPTCTDAGATYVIASVPNRPYLLRAANCATRKSEALSLAAINL